MFDVFTIKAQLKFDLDRITAWLWAVCRCCTGKLDSLPGSLLYSVLLKKNGAHSATISHRCENSKIVVMPVQKIK